MNRDFKLDTLNNVLTINFSTLEEKREFEEKISGLLKDSETGSIVRKNFDLFTIASGLNIEMSNEINEEILDLLAIEVFSLLYDDTGVRRLKISAIFDKTVDYSDLKLKVYDYNDINNSMKEEKKELEDLCDQNNVAYDIANHLNVGSFGKVVGYCTEERVEKKSVDTGVQLGTKSKKIIYEELFKIIEDKKNEVIEGDQKIYFRKSFLDPTLHEFKQDGMNSRYGHINLPEFSLLMTSTNKAHSGYNKLHSHLLVRFEKGFEKLTFWHKKGVNFEKEIKYIEKMVKENLKKVILKSKYVQE